MNHNHYKIIQGQLKWSVRLLVVLWSVGLLVVFLLGRPVQATSLPSGVQIETNGAVPTFPDVIVFQFKATASADGPRFQAIDLAYRLEGDVATSLRHQKLEPGGVLQAEIKIDTHEEYVPPGTRFNYYWRLTDETGETYQTAAQSFVYQDTRYPFRELKKGLVTVRWYQGSAAFGQQALDKATSTIDRLSRLYKASPDLPINLTIYPDSRTMFTALPPNTQEWVGGQAVPELGTIVLSIGPNDQNEIGRSIPHEVSHQVVYQATRNPYNAPPKWLDEGLAVNNQDQVDGFLNAAFERARADHTLFSLRVLNGPFPTDSQQSFVAYGQSVQVVRYIIKKYGEGAIEKMLAAFKEGRSYDEIVGVGLGLSVDELDRQWKQSIAYPVPALLDPTPTPGLSASPPTPRPPTVVPATLAPPILNPTIEPSVGATLVIAPSDLGATKSATVTPIRETTTPVPPVAQTTRPVVTVDSSQAAEWPVAGLIGLVLLVVVGLVVGLRLVGAKRG